MDSGCKPTLLLENFFNCSTKQASKHRLHIRAQWALKGLELLEAAITLTHDTLCG
jgi:hypothetical protein